MTNEEYLEKLRREDEYWASAEDWELLADAQTRQRPLDPRFVRVLMARGLMGALDRLNGYRGDAARTVSTSESD
jgi:hypothetical protein